jgi:hypothetical protein
MTACVVYFVLRRRLGHRGAPPAVPQYGVQQYQQYPQHPPHPGPGSAAHFHAGYPYPPSTDTYGGHSESPRHHPYPLELMEQGANELDGGQYEVRKPYELR